MFASPVIPTLVAMPGAPELILIFAVIVLLFGAKKLPELARGSGQALRIFKAETQAPIDPDDNPAGISDGAGDPREHS